MSSSQTSSGKCRQVRLDDIKEATNNFHEDNVIGKGGEGKVYLAKIKHGWNITQVAVKHLKPNAQKFEKEIKTISKIQHPNLVSLFGYCNESDQKILLYEYMENGSLDAYVKKKSSLSLSWLQRIRICLDAARGLQYLHIATDENPKGIIHRDVKPHNILLGKDWVAKISDFGMFKLSHAGQLQSTMKTDLKGTGGYYAPEYLRHQSITRKIDVYAFGVVLFEVLCHKTPWDRGDESYYWMEDEDLGAWAHQNVNPSLKPEISDKSLKEFCAIIGKSLKGDPRKRPSMDGVVLGLEKVLKSIERGDEAKKGRAAKAPSEHSTVSSHRGTTSVVSEIIPEDEYNTTIVLDTGGGKTKAGFAGEVHPEVAQKVNRGFLKGRLIGLKRFLFSRRDTRIAKVLGEGRKHINLEHGAVPVGLLPASSAGTEYLPSRTILMDQVMKALSNDEIYMIGICGMEGMGKTRLTDEVKRRVLEEQLCDAAVKVDVSHDPDILDLQEMLARSLGLELNEIYEDRRACKLLSRLTDGSKNLIILTNIWQKVEFQRVGLPLKGEEKGCKVVFTCRNSYLTWAMGSDQSVDVFPLPSHEGRLLFRKIAGKFEEDLVDKVADGCVGIPLAIDIVASSLGNKPREVWVSALDQLRKSTTTTETVLLLELLFSRIKLSFDLLGSSRDEAQQLLLLCCLFPDGADIPPRDLVRYVEGLKVLKSSDNLVDTSNRVFKLLDVLKGHSLLLHGDNEMTVKMNRCVRDACFSVSSEEDMKRFQVKHKPMLMQLPK